ncbi:MAG: hypothetical protein ACOCVU_08175, partial [Desulfohalobiaceae bacterium]
MAEATQKKPAAKSKKSASGPGKDDTARIKEQIVLTGSDIVAIGEEAELLVGGKNYNTAIISQLDTVRAPQFRAISSQAFHKLL